jgi:hypothetical protein
MGLIEHLLSVVIATAGSAGPWIVAGALAIAAAYLIGRTLVERKTATESVTLALVPRPGHTIDAGAVRGMAASQGSAVRRRGGSLLGHRVDGVTVTHRPDAHGKLITLLTVPHHAKGGVLAALAQWPNVEVRPITAVELPQRALATPSNYAAHADPPGLTDLDASTDPTTTRRKPYIARMELRRGGGAIGTLVVDGLLERNPLGAVANCGRDLATDMGEDFALVIQQLPLNNRQAVRYRSAIGKKLDRWTKSAKKQGIDTLAQLRIALGSPDELKKTTTTTTATASERQDDLDARKEARKQSLKDQPLSRVRIYIYARAETAERARSLVNSVHDALAPLNGAAHLKAVGIGGGLLPFIGINALKPHRLTDRNIAKGMMPTKAPVLTAAELGPLAGPATDHAHSQHVRRAIPLEPAPEDMPTYDRDNPDHVLMGEVATYTGEKERKALSRKDKQMALITAGTGNGKTTVESTDTIHIARASDRALTPRKGETAVTTEAAIQRGLRGTTWIDPEGTVAEPIRPYLADLKNVKVCEVNLRGNERVPAWNPLSMYGRSEDEVDDVSEATVSAVASALGWRESSNRAILILTMTCRALVALNLRACEAGRPDAQTTIYQIIDMLDVDDPTFRETATKLLPEHMRPFWKNVTQNYARDALPVVTNAFRRLEPENSSLTAFFGRPVSTLDFRDVLNNGHLVFFTPPQSKADKLITHLIVANLMREAIRRNPARGALVPHEINIDEINSLRDMEEVAMLFERGRKREAFMKALAQAPQRMDPTTQQGIVANSTYLQVGRFTGRDAAIAASWLGLPDPAAFDDLERYHWYIKYPINGVQHGPSLVRGCPPAEVWGDLARPDLVTEYLERMDQQFQRQTYKEAAPTYQRHRAHVAAFLQSQLTSPKQAKRQPLGFTSSRTES